MVEFCTKHIPLALKLHSMGFELVVATNIIAISSTITHQPISTIIEDMTNIFYYSVNYRFVVSLFLNLNI